MTPSGTRSSEQRLQRGSTGSEGDMPDEALPAFRVLGTR
jgi:hypothetical protein